MPTTSFRHYSNWYCHRWKTRNGGGAGRFSVIQSSTSAANFPTSALLTVTTTSAPSGTEIYGFEQDIEGYNIADFGWGTANAQSVTVSFQVRSSLTGTYCVSLRNSAADRSYVVEFTINSANTFETKTITVPAITTGTWLSTNGAGLLFLVCLGSGSTREGTAGSWQSSNIVATSNQVDWINTSGATFYITGVQLEKGSTATSFDYRPYTQEEIMADNSADIAKRIILNCVAEAFTIEQACASAGKSMKTYEYYRRTDKVFADKIDRTRLGLKDKQFASGDGHRLGCCQGQSSKH